MRGRHSSASRLLKATHEGDVAVDARLISEPTVVPLEVASDARGSFERLVDNREFDANGPAFSEIVNVNRARSAEKGTLRGFHVQVQPHVETKLIVCLRGAVFDVAVDLRAGSQTALKSWSFEIHSSRPEAVVIPPGFAHAYLTLEDNCELLYFTDCEYAPQSERVIRWDDPDLNVAWPIVPRVVSEKDSRATDYRSEPFLIRTAC